MVPGGASCRIVNTFFVAEYIKSKMTRERDLSQVNFIASRFEIAATLLVKEVPTEDSTCYVRNFHQNSKQ